MPVLQEEFPNTSPLGGAPQSQSSWRTSPILVLQEELPNASPLVGKDLTPCRFLTLFSDNRLHLRT